MVPHPAQVWVVIAWRSSIMGWACHQAIRQARLQNRCPLLGWSIVFPQCSHTPSVGVRVACGVMLLRLHHDFTISRPTPVICAIFPKAPPSRREMIFLLMCCSTVVSPSFPHTSLSGAKTGHDALLLFSRRRQAGGDNPRYSISAPTHRCVGGWGENLSRRIVAARAGSR